MSCSLQEVISTRTEVHNHTNATEPSSGNDQLVFVFLNLSRNSHFYISSPLHVRCCCVCDETTSSHLMVSCDTCNNFYHIFCLDPPLSRVPKKSRKFGWWVCVKQQQHTDKQLLSVHTKAMWKLLLWQRWRLEANCSRKWASFTIRETSTIKQKFLLRGSEWHCFHYVTLLFLLSHTHSYSYTAAVVCTTDSGDVVGWMDSSCNSDSRQL